MKDIGWAPYADCTCTTYVLRGQAGAQKGGLSAEDASASLRENPERALVLWKSQKTSSSYLADGRISMVASGQELFPEDLLVDIFGFWSQLLRLIKDLLETGYGEAEVGYRSVPLSLRLTNSSLLFRLNGATYAASPQAFLLGLLAGAEEFFSWFAENIGGHHAEEREALARIQATLNN